MSLLNDPGGDISRASSDFYSGSGNTGYYAQDSSYLYFRMRINYSGAIAAGTLSDSYFVFLDRHNWSSGGTADGFPDFSLTWDAKSNNNNNHGLEMLRFSSLASGNLWSGLRMTDVDGLSGQKGTLDIGGVNGTERSGEGYVRTLDGASGGGAFLDLAVSFDYLQNRSGTGLGLGQAWSITFGSIQNANDHNFLDGDVAGGSSPGDSIANGWATITTPEPTVSQLIVLMLFLFLAVSKSRRPA